MNWSTLKQVTLAGFAAIALVFAAVAMVPMAAAAAPPPTPANSPDQAAAQGLAIFSHDKFGGVMTCSSCHLNGGTTLGKVPGGGMIPSLKGAASQFPRYNPRAKRVVTLEQQIAMCIEGRLRGKAPPAGSPQMTDLTAYLVKLSKGWTMGKQFK